MAVTVPVPLTPEEEAALRAQAAAQGLSVESLVHQAVLRIISSPPQVNSEQYSAQQWEKEFGEWLDSLPGLPALSDDALSRESIYTREDEWR